MSEKKGLTNLQQRVLAGIAGVAIMFACIYISEWGYFLLFFVISMLTQMEFYKLIGLDGNIPLKWYGTVSGLVLYTLTFLVEKHIISSFYFFLICPIMSFVFFIKLYKKTEKKPFTNIALTFLGIIYASLPFSLTTISAYSKGIYSWQIVLGSLLLLWASDTGAYFAGKTFGKKKLFERISPKKTWEGSVGGLVLSLLVASVLGYYFQDLKTWQWFCICIIIVITGTYGDLVESLFKRSIEIKDSGSSIPGHGGFLDRFDGLLLSAPFIVVFLKMITVINS